MINETAKHQSCVRMVVNKRSCDIFIVFANISEPFIEARVV